MSDKFFDVENEIMSLQQQLLLKDNEISKMKHKASVERINTADNELEFFD